MEDNVKFTPELLKKMLSEKSMEMTLQEIEEMMDEEIEKPEEEMDTELIDMCASILAKAYNPDYKNEKPAEMFRPWEMDAAETAVLEKPKKKVIPFKRVLIVAAAVSLVVVAFFALPAGAMLIPGEASNSIIKFYSDHFKINLLKEEPTTVSDNWLHSLISNNLSELTLPEELLKNEYQKSYQVDESENLTITYITLKNTKSNIKGNIIITQYTDENAVFINGSIDVSDMYRYFKQMSVDGLDVFVFGDDNQMYINYIEGAIGYEIILDCNFDKAISIAETINTKDEK